MPLQGRCNSRGLTTAALIWLSSSLLTAIHSLCASGSGALQRMHTTTKHAEWLSHSLTTAAVAILKTVLAVMQLSWLLT
jgi:hypothetical protein